MAEGVFCGACGEPTLPGVATCPKCGSTERFARATGTAHGTSAAVAIPFSARRVLDTAKGLLARGDFALAVVVGQTACEVATERALSRAFAARGVPELEGPVMAGFLSKNPTDKRLRRVYKVLTGDGIQDRPFWGPLNAAANLRNLIVHAGRDATKEQAEAALQAAGAFLAHLGQ